tara:strand:+ start:3899 stop:4333 length:435 start_codon:yes stop_codon:yes gene_type:complete
MGHDTHTQDAGTRAGIGSGSGFGSVLRRLEAEMQSIKNSAVENSSGNPPDGYSELENTPAQLVADACWQQGIDSMETAILNWIYDKGHSDEVRMDWLEKYGTTPICSRGAIDAAMACQKNDGEIAYMMGARPNAEVSDAKRSLD